MDLEPDKCNSDIFSKFTLIYHPKIKVEKPIFPSSFFQCQRRKSVGHITTYCNHQPQCVKCREFHLTENCQKLSDQQLSSAYLMSRTASC